MILGFGKARLLAIAAVGVAVAGTTVVLRRSQLVQAIAALKADRFEEALSRLRPLGTLGDSEAQYLIGYIYALGLGRPSSSEEALKWFRRSSGCIRSNAPKVAMDALSVATAYAEGKEGVAPNERAAVTWLKIAAENGSTEAANWLHRVYSEGLLGLPKDPQQAEYWLHKIKSVSD